MTPYLPRDQSLQDAYSRFGKGRHPAALNFGDCCTYAVASVAGEPLLCLGDDFAKTDLLLGSLDTDEIGTDTTKADEPTLSTRVHYVRGRLELAAARTPTHAPLSESTPSPRRRPRRDLLHQAPAPAPRSPPRR